MKSQRRVMIDSNAGGVGKSTVAGQLATKLALKGYSVALLDLDISASQNVFFGLNHVEAGDSVAKIFWKDFDGNWPLKKIPGLKRLEVCQGSPELEKVIEDLGSRDRKAYVLRDALQDNPLPHDFIFFDCPGSRGIANKNALAAATDVLFVMQAESKSVDGFAGLLEWCSQKSKDLRLTPQPRFLGALPNMVERNTPAHMRAISDLEEVLPQLQLPLFPSIRSSKEFKNAAEYGVPLTTYRPGHPANADFQPVISALEEVMEK